MIDYIALKNELINDPLVRGYSGMSDEQALADLLTAYRTKAVQYVSGSQILNATDDVEFAALTLDQRTLWVSMCSSDRIEVSSGVAKSIEADLFGPGSTTRDNLVALKTENITRALELGLYPLQLEDITYARSL